MEAGEAKVASEVWGDEKIEAWCWRREHAQESYLSVVVEGELVVVEGLG